MRFMLIALFLCAVAAVPARAANCSWAVTPNISPPDDKLGIGAGRSWPSHWTWQYTLHADHYCISGIMSSYAYRCTTNLSASATGNATFTVSRIIACWDPIEDIEANARNEFTARAEIDDDSFARAQGSMRIHAPKMGLDCHACGGVEATSSGHGDGTTGTFTVPLYPAGPNMVIHWSKGGSIEQAFQASDSKTGGRSPESFVCQTNLDLAVSVGWYDDSGLAHIKGSKSELKVYGTCDGYCGVVVPVIDDSVGY